MRSSPQCLAGLLGDANKASFLNLGTFWAPLIAKWPFPECNEGCPSARDLVGLFVANSPPLCRTLHNVPSPLQNVKDWGLNPSLLAHLHSWGEEKGPHLSAAPSVPEKVWYQRLHCSADFCSLGRLLHVQGLLAAHSRTFPTIFSGCCCCCALQKAAGLPPWMQLARQAEEGRAWRSLGQLGGPLGLTRDARLLLFSPLLGPFFSASP